MSNEWSGDGGFSKGADGAWSETNHVTGVQPEHEWDRQEPPTADFNDWGSSSEHTSHRAEGGNVCGMSPWKLLGNVIAYGLIIVVVFCIAAFIAGCVMGAVGAL